MQVVPSDAPTPGSADDGRPAPGTTVLVTPDGLTVRVAADDELDAAGAAVRDAYAVDGFAGSSGYLDTLADARSRSRDATVVVAVGSSGRVLGSVTFALPGTRWAELSAPGQTEFRALGVAPGARGRGVGEALTRWCVEESRRLGSTALVMCSLDVMHAAHRLYRRLGFDRRPDLDWEPSPGVRLLGFALDLRPAGPLARDGEV